jgi:hypothetical protein
VVLRPCLSTGLPLSEKTEKIFSTLIMIIFYNKGMAIARVAMHQFSPVQDRHTLFIGTYKKGRVTRSGCLCGAVYRKRKLVFYGQAKNMRTKYFEGMKSMFFMPALLEIFSSPRAVTFLVVFP